ncbi:MAG: ABC transporter ATP-binding protein [Firmicutes bacterium]|nr:ABC transporter ATP-binding protein [Bacillota bacterium]
MAEEILRTENLNVGYGTNVIVKDVEIRAYAGQIQTLIGPNGAGKSTILKTLIRQISPLNGNIFLKGTNIRQLTEKQMAQNISVVLTTRPNVELMTCRDIVSSGRYPFTGSLGILSAKDHEIVDESMELVRVTDLAEKDFNNISDGQRQRVMLARAICQQPRLLIMDEPTSFLDIKHKLDFLYLLGNLVKQRQIAVILSLHELEFAQRFSDTIYCVDDGLIDRQGPPEEIFTGNYIETLYKVEHGTYNVLFGGIETGAVTGIPRVLVLGGGGDGIPVYRKLTRMGVPFAAGVLSESDVDFPVAKALASAVINVPAFAPVTSSAADKAIEMLESCGKLICACESFGPLNEENKRVLDYARSHNMLVTKEEMERTFTQPYSSKKDD